MSDLSALAAALNGTIGKNDDQTEVTDWLDMVYPPLNKMLSGDYAKGLPLGRIIEIYGPSASGKTLLATMAMIAAQKAGGVAIFIDWERAFQLKFAIEMGLNPDFPHFIYKRAETWEEGNMQATRAAQIIRQSKAIPANAPIVAVFDSVAAAVPKSMLYDSKGKERQIDELTMNDTTALARVTSTTLKAINQHVGNYNMTAIYLNQIRTKPGVVYGDPTTTPGGVAMEFYASIRLALGQKKIMEEAAGGKEFVGRLIGLETKKNKLSKPFQSTELRLVYDDEGRAHFDYVDGLLQCLIDEGKIPKDGKMYVWEGKKYFQSVLSEKLDKEGKYAELVAMLTAPAAVAA